jgi:hypothetical protein
MIHISEFLSDLVTNCSSSPTISSGTSGLIMMQSGSCGELRQSLLSSFPHPLRPIAGADSDDVANLCQFCVQADQIWT